MLKIKNKNVFIIHSIILLISTALMIMLCFKNSDGIYIDVAINHALSNAQSLYGRAFAHIGEYPQYFLIPISIMILFYNVDRIEDKNKQIILKILSAIGVYLGWALFAFASHYYSLIGEHKVIIAISITIILGSLTLGAGYFIPKNVVRNLFKLALFSLLFVIVSYVLINITKIMWCRFRYRDMLKEYGDIKGTNPTGFSPWYKPMIGRSDKIIGKGYEYTSFPSGHTSAATHIFIICLLPNYFKKLDKKWIRCLLYIISTIFVIVVAISRIVNNAHYLSDVISGGVFTYFIFYILKVLFFKNDEYILLGKEKNIENS